MSFVELLNKLKDYFTKYPHPNPERQVKIFQLIQHKLDFASKNIHPPRTNIHLRKIYILPHGGMGDHITMIAAVRVYSMMYDEVMVGVLNKYASNVRQIYADDPSIKVHGFTLKGGKTTIDPVPFLDSFRKQGYEILVPSVGCWGGQKGGKPPQPNLAFYRSFYDQCNLDYNICRPQFSHICRNLENEKQLSEKLNPTHEPYAFVHGDNRVMKKATALTKLKIITPDGPMIDHCSLIENATEIYVMDSSFFCLCCVLNLKAMVKNVYVRTASFCKIYNVSKSRYMYPNDTWNLISLEILNPPRPSKPIAKKVKPLRKKGGHVRRSRLLQRRK